MAPGSIIGPLCCGVKNPSPLLNICGIVGAAIGALALPILNAATGGRGGGGAHCCGGAACGAACGAGWLLS